MSRAGINEVEAYQQYLNKNPDELLRLLDTILINVTGFFRDPFTWKFLQKHVLPRIIRPDEGIRVWSAGCSSGQEVYSLAMLLADAMGTDHFRQHVTIFGTDIDDAALRQARRGSYSAKDIVGIPLALLNKFFQRDDGHFVFIPILRPSIFFCHHDLVHDPPFCHLDLLMCRNTLIYFNQATQKRVFARFHLGLKNTGYLFLGTGESAYESENLFKTVSETCHIFQKVPKFTADERLKILHQAGTFLHMEGKSFSPNCKRRNMHSTALTGRES